MSHPAACPYCGGTIVNQAQPDMQLRHAQLNDDGSIIVGDVVDAADFQGPCLLFCHSCGSTYEQPANVVEHYHSELKLTYEGRVPGPADDKYIGNDVRWIVEPVIKEAAHG